MARILEAQVDALADSRLSNEGCDAHLTEGHRDTCTRRTAIDLKWQEVPKLGRRSLGSFVILDHVIQAGMAGLPHVYLGYWVRGSEKMDYKIRFSPIELLKAEGWVLSSTSDLGDGL